jgi:hypothetical protein
LKFPYEYFRKELNLPDELDNSYLPTDFKKLKYQEDAVLNAVRVLEEFGGVFIADVVGLGKTFMSALLARHLDGRSLVIAPPHLLDKHNPGAWPNVFRDFGVRGAEFESIGKLQSLLDNEDLDKYQYVIQSASPSLMATTPETRTFCRHTVAPPVKACGGARRAANVRS